MLRYSDRLARSRGQQQPAWQRCTHAHTPGIRIFVRRIRAQAGSPPSLVHRLDVAQPTQQTTEEKRHE
jgi:hypothetical protein